MPGMDNSSPLWLYALLVGGIVVLPGMDMALVAASSLSGGLRSGLAALAGIVLGGLLHMAAGLLGLGLLLQNAPLLFNAVLLLGALYVGRLGLQILRAGALSATAAGHAPGAGSGWRQLRRGLVTCLLNPKAALFSVTVLPQFMTRDLGRGLALAAITASAQVLVYGAVAWAASAGTQRFQSSAGFGRAVGALLVASAVWALWHGWHGWQGWRGLPLAA